MAGQFVDYASGCGVPDETVHHLLNLVNRQIRDTDLGVGSAGGLDRARLVEPGLSNLRVPEMEESDTGHRLHGTHMNRLNYHKMPSIIILVAVLQLVAGDQLV
jgi:hypothetical protein